MARRARKRVEKEGIGEKREGWPRLERRRRRRRTHRAEGRGEGAPFRVVSSSFWDDKNISFPFGPAWWHGRHMSPVATERRKPTEKGEKKPQPNEPKKIATSSPRSRSIRASPWCRRCPLWVSRWDFSLLSAAP